MRSDGVEATTAPTDGEPAPEVLSVGGFSARLRGALRAIGIVWVEGEVVSYRGPAPSGHLYFSLKDEREDATIGCAMYRRDAQYGGGDRIVNGARVRVRGEASLYAPRGSLQLIVSRVTAAGQGDLLARREERKRKLAAEGLFDASKKRKLPDDPRVVGVVTSGAGAAFADIVKVALRRAGVRILLAPSQVQGAEAPRQLVAALGKLEALEEVDVIIIGRGGGSAEDLAAFDDESVVRAIAGCKKPVVAAVGHEIDWSISCLAADVRAATPSQAAELVVPDSAARKARLFEGQRRLGLAMRALVRHDQAALARLSARMRAPERQLALHRQRLDDLDARLHQHMRATLDQGRRTSEALARRLAARHPRTVIADAKRGLAPTTVRLRAAIAKRLAKHRATLDGLAELPSRAIDHVLERQRNKLALSAQRLNAISPLAVLSRGYAIAMVRGADGEWAAIRDAKSVKVGDLLEVRLTHEVVEAEVKGARKA